MLLTGNKAADRVTEGILRTPLLPRRYFMVLVTEPFASQPTRGLAHSLLEADLFRGASPFIRRISAIDSAKGQAGRLQKHLNLEIRLVKPGPASIMGDGWDRQTLEVQAEIRNLPCVCTSSGGKMSVYVGVSASNAWGHTGVVFILGRSALLADKNLDID